MTGAFTCRDESPPPDQEDGTELEHLGTGTATRAPSVCRKDSAIRNSASQSSHHAQRLRLVRSGEYFAGSALSRIAGRLP